LIVGFLEILENMFGKNLNINMKFDVIVGNPPYQKMSENGKKTEPIWQKFVEKSFEHCKEGGTVALIHPSGWRNVAGKFKDTQELLKSKNLKYLEIHDADDGLKTFGAGTRYDWYICENKEYEGALKSKIRVVILNISTLKSGILFQVAHLIVLKSCWRKMWNHG
jgi:hypothetical protein